MSNKKLPKINILYEDQDIVAIDKPAGLMVHADGRNEGPFLTDWVIKKFPSTMNVGEPARDEKGNDLPRPGIVHRLDRETSGVMLVAKTNRGHKFLKEQFQKRIITKKYLAFVWGDMKENFGSISKPIGRSGSDFRKWSAQRGARGEMKEAETYWTKVGIIKKEDLKEGPFCLIEVEPKTGRTHQIRVHFVAIQHPVVGDTLYAPKKPMVLSFGRTALHSRSIKFETCQGKTVTIEAPLPNDFKKALKAGSIKYP